MPTLKTDQITPTDEHNADTSEKLHEFLDYTKSTCMSVVAAFLIIILFIVGPFKPQGYATTFVIRIAIALVLVYGIFMNCQAMEKMYNIKGIFTLNSMADIRINFILSAVFTALILALAIIIIYKQLNSK
jgi:hypothetical protein